MQYATPPTVFRRFSGARKFANQVRRRYQFFHFSDA